MGKKILIVEDESELAQNFQEYLSSLGLEVTIAADGYDALEKVVGGHFDLITMDLIMPRLGGLEAAELIRFRNDVTTPIIVISAYAEDNMEKLQELRIDAVLHKPVDFQELRESIANLIDIEEERGT